MNLDEHPDEPTCEYLHEPSYEENVSSEASHKPFSSHEGHVKIQKRLQVRVHDGWGPTYLPTLIQRLVDKCTTLCSFNMTGNKNVFSGVSNVFVCSAFSILDP